MSDSSSGQVPTRTVAAAPQSPAKNGPSENVIEPQVLEQILAQQGISPGKAGVVIQQITTEIRRMHAGPLPSVEDYRGYEEVCPGAARDILDMAIRQQKHHNSVERTAVICDFLLPVIGILAAVFVIGGLLGAGVYLAMNGHERLAVAAISGTGAATIVGAFLQRKKTKKAEDKKPQEKPANKRRRK
jgi:uncharacterized membrane protein